MESSSHGKIQYKLACAHIHTYTCVYVKAGP